MPKVIALIGSKGAGKDTCADFAVRTYPNAKKLSFARTFKDKIMKGILNFTDYMIDDPAGKEEVLKKNLVLDHKKLRLIVHTACDLYNQRELGKKLNPYSIALSNWENKTFVAGVNTNRDVMRFVSTEIIRRIHPDWHIHLTLSGLNKQDVYIIADMRFKNELEFAQSQFGKEFHAVYVKNVEAETKNKDSHISEQEYKTFVEECDHMVSSTYGEIPKLEKEFDRLFNLYVTGKRPQGALKKPKLEV